MSSSIDRSTKAAGAIGGKTARACENCLVKRARWFCSADEAFLCQACDSSVHSANLLASKHERFRLETSSCKIDHSSPAWHRGFAKKPRTPRQPKKLLRGSSLSSQFLQTTVVDTVVPEINCEEYGPFHHHYDEEEEQSACMVPVFADPNFQDEYFRSVGAVDDDLDIGELFTAACDVDSFFGVCNKDLGLRRAVFESEGDEEGVECRGNRREVKSEGDEETEQLNAFHFDPILGVEMDWDFDCNSNGESVAGGISSETKIEAVLDEEATRNMCATSGHRRDDHHHHQSKEGLYEKRTNNNTLLRLDSEAVIAAWADQGESPWIDGARPHQFNIDEFMVDECLGKLVRSCDGEREARVSRYRDKRRTRLFSKKIRYQVRKLNAEKRPRVKGRFVKRTAATNSYLPYSFM